MRKALFFMLLISVISIAKASILDVRKGYYSNKIRYVFDVRNVHRFSVKNMGDVLIIKISKLKIFYKLPFIPSKVYYFKLYHPERLVMDVYKPKPKSYIKNKVRISYIPTFLSNRANGRKVVVIDPGHGGKDPGGIGLYGVEEKNVVLAIGKKLDYFLRRDPRFKVIMTRDKDVFVPLQERAMIAIKNRADLFISIHCNIAPDHIEWPHGTNIYYLSSAGINRKYNELVKNVSFDKVVFGNALDTQSISARKILAKMALKITKDQSYIFAKDLAFFLNKELHRHVTLHNIHRRNFVVLRTPGIPSVLVETGFLTNKEDVKKLTNPQYQWKFAKAMYDAIVYYFFGNHYNYIAHKNMESPL
ncbi:MAG: N-acetylmuramoyl-L-alanine amidase family protein [Hydrogenobaculum sp.]